MPWKDYLKERWEQCLHYWYIHNKRLPVIIYGIKSILRFTFSGSLFTLNLGELHDRELLSSSSSSWLKSVEKWMNKCHWIDSVYLLTWSAYNVAVAKVPIKRFHLDTLSWSLSHQIIWLRKAVLTACSSWTSKHSWALSGYSRDAWRSQGWALHSFYLFLWLLLESSHFLQQTHGKQLKWN